MPSARRAVRSIGRLCSEEARRPDPDRRGGAAVVPLARSVRTPGGRDRPSTLPSVAPFRPPRTSCRNFQLSYSAFRPLLSDPSHVLSAHHSPLRPRHPPRPLHPTLRAPPPAH